MKRHEFAPPCHCEEQSDEAISIRRAIDAGPSLQRRLIGARPRQAIGEGTGVERAIKAVPRLAQHIA